MKEELDRMREILEVVQRTAEQERVNAETARRNSEYFRELLEREKEKKEDLEKQLRMAKQELMTSCWEPEPMETEEVGETGVPALDMDTERIEAEREKGREGGGERNPSHTRPENYNGGGVETKPLGETHHKRGQDYYGGQTPNKRKANHHRK